MSQATMKKAPAVQLEAPRFENAEPLRIAGLREHFTPETMKNIPELWRRFGPHIGNIPGQVGHAAYGLCFNALGPDGVDYLAGVEVSNSSDRPGDFSFANIPAQKYAVFSHREHVSTGSDGRGSCEPRLCRLGCGTPRRSVGRLADSPNWDYVASFRRPHECKWITRTARLRIEE